MSKLEKAYYALQRMEMRAAACDDIVDPRANIIVSLLDLCMMLSVPMGRVSTLIWFALYPIVSSAWLGVRFGRVFLNSLYVLPVVVLIGIFNPILDHMAAFKVGGLTVSVGWLTFTSVIIRGLLAMQCILILISSCGFIGICRGLRQMHVPAFLTDQLQFVYRYISVLLLEALSMRRAREARGFGRKSFPLKLWGVMIGQLFLRAIDRSERINRAMMARGFDGTLPRFAADAEKSLLTSPSTIFYILLLGGGSVALRFMDTAALFNWVG